MYRLPQINDLLLGCSCFSTLNLPSGYWQVGVSKDSQEKTAFITCSGLCVFTVMLSKLCNVPTTFQWLMEHVLAGVVREKCLIYLDDIFMMESSQSTLQEHL